MRGVRMQTNLLQRNPDINWLFDVSKASGLSPCVAFRASKYVTYLSAERAGRRVVSRCNRLFHDIKNSGSTQKSMVSPFVYHCLFISIKIETQEWGDNPKIMQFALHNHFSTSNYTNSAEFSKILMTADFEISMAMDWNMIPVSPFHYLQELFDNRCFYLLNDAIELCTHAIVYEMNVPCARTLACAAVVATGSIRGGVACKTSLVRGLNCLVLLSSTPSAFDAVDYSVVLSTSQNLEELYVKINNRGKRKL